MCECVCGSVGVSVFVCVDVGVRDGELLGFSTEPA